MNPPSRTLLEFQIHLINGHSIEATLSLPADVDLALRHFSEPERLFAHQDLIIVHDHTTSVFRREHITWIDIVGQSLPQWPLPLGAQAITEIDEEQYKQQLGAMVTSSYGAIQGGLGSSRSALEIEFINGKRLYWQIQRAPMEVVGVDVVSFERNFFCAGGLHARRAGGGLAIINPANVSRFTFAPGISQMPPNALHASHVDLR